MQTIGSSKDEIEIELLSRGIKTYSTTQQTTILDLFPKDNSENILIPL